MINPGLLSERLTVLPLRLDTIAFGRAPGIQDPLINQGNVSHISQGNVSYGMRGDCVLSICNQISVQVNVAPVVQLRMTP